MPVEPGPDGRVPAHEMLAAFELAMKAEGIGPSVRQRILNRVTTGAADGYRPLIRAFAGNRSVSQEEAFPRAESPVRAPASPPSFLDVVRKAARTQGYTQQSMLRPV